MEFLRKTDFPVYVYASMGSSTGEGVKSRFSGEKENILTRSKKVLCYKISCHFRTGMGGDGQNVDWKKRKKEMTGTIVNTCTILAGSLIGSILKKGIKENQQNALYTAMGLAATGLGINAVVQNMPKSIYPVLFIVSLALGSLVGTAIDIDGKFQKLTEKLSVGQLSRGLSTGILLFCIGTLSILGPVQSALYGDHTYLFTNAALDFVTSMVLASTYGIGMALTAPVLFCWQGAIYAAACMLGNFMTADMMTELSVVGGFLIAGSGLSILNIRDCKTMNMLPALVIPPVFCWTVGFF
jgi:uncharacterized membrane protein YqgA involved in biofilm formation